MKKKAKRLQLSKETLVHLRGGWDTGRDYEGEASYSLCSPDCMDPTSCGIEGICKTTPN